MPPGLSPEQAWAWALDNFEALCRHSCQGRGEEHSHERQPLPWVSTQGRPTPTVARGQKRRRESHVHDPTAHSTEELQAAQGAAEAEVSRAPLAPNQPGDAGIIDRAAQIQAPSICCSPGQPRKLLKTQAYSSQQPKRKGSPAFGKPLA
ncbi:hypothetical protein H920_00085 [Fukomys damarensis]|uniref:Uncharacterized protein n=2 Tax=Fukomys damarensis TaxID=885580 RepID=A0A091E7B2_FUKDA|nr:hypothetical protein H920_00085 [Fukomys damarensis]